MEHMLLSYEWVSNHGICSLGTGRAQGTKNSNCTTTLPSAVASRDLAILGFAAEG